MVLLSQIMEQATSSFIYLLLNEQAFFHCEKTKGLNINYQLNEGKPQQLI
jgi:hypothetical protein